MIIRAVICFEKKNSFFFIWKRTFEKVFSFPYFETHSKLVLSQIGCLVHVGKKETFKR